MIRLPKGRPRKYIMQKIEPGQHVTGDMIREIAANYPDGELRKEMLAMATTLHARGWIETGGRLYMTEAKTRSLLADAEKLLKLEDPPGFQAGWEGTVGVYEYADGGEPTLCPVITMYALNAVESDEAVAERFTPVAQEHGLKVGRRQ